MRRPRPIRVSRPRCSSWIDPTVGRLLAEGTLGRIAVDADRPDPVIRPVNYVFDEPSQSVLIRSGAIRNESSRLEETAHDSRYLTTEPGHPWLRINGSASGSGSGRAGSGSAGRPPRS